MTPISPGLFPDAFMRQYTDFHSLQQMLDASGLEEAPDLSGEAWSQFVAAHTRFGSREALLTQALADWTRRQLTR